MKLLLIGERKRMTKQRNSNMELLRILAMLMIVAFHIYFHCIRVQLIDLNSIALLNNGLFNTPDFYKKLLLLVTVAQWGQIGNVIFIIVSGYFMVSRGGFIDLTKISKKLLFQQAFAAVVLVLGSTIVFVMSDGIFVNLVDINLFNNMSWYVGYYFLIIVFAGLFLNKFIEKLNKKQYIKFLLILFAFTQFYWIGELINSLSDRLLVFCTGVFLYSLGGYIQKYNPFSNIRTAVIVGGIILVYILIYISSYNITESDIQTYFRNGSVGPFIQNIQGVKDNYFVPISIGVAIFELFRRMPSFNSKLINVLGKSTFMVYLWHDNDFVHSFWNNQDWITILYNQPILFLLKLFGWTILTFLAGVLIYLLYVGFTKILKLYGLRILCYRK